MDEIENYSNSKGGYFLMALMIGAVISAHPELSAKYNDKDNFVRYTKEMSDYHRTNDKVKERIPLH